ncbi:MAG TPA: ornithine cyclodeaminase family protein [Candidatus Krumholzibacteria bacterium]|nr:ornithine cyclodeaminase family protein [Candidatus Krumholzibacteria bacterium]
MRRRETLLLTRGEVAALLGIDECIAAVERAFALHAAGRSLPPGVLGVHAPGGGFHLKAAGLQMGRSYFAAKLNGNFPGNRERFGLPTIQGVVVLCDADNGSPLALMDSMQITILRTGAATAAAAKRLARASASAAAIIGCGNQGRVQLRALARVLPLRRVWAFDTEAPRLRAFLEEMSTELGLEVEPAGDPGAAARAADVCVTCTPSRRAFLRPGDLQPGAFLAAVGADSDDKQELEPTLVAGCKIVVDDLEQCATIGELHHALEAGLLTRADVHADLAAVIAGDAPGRTSEDEIILFDSTGTALQDVAAAAMVYEMASAAGAGTWLDLGR